MKIALVQLARLGDIIMMWPLIRAIKRTYPGCHLTLVTRENYKIALSGLDDYDSCFILPSRYLLEPILGMQRNAEESQRRLREWIGCVQKQNFDWVINLTYSPFSADLTYALTQNQSPTIAGYSRFHDGFLRTADRTSEYFYSQVGVTKDNQIHLLELFSRVLHVQLVEEDFHGPEQVKLPAHLQVPQKYFTFHLGASEIHKRPQTQHVLKVMEALLECDPHLHFVCLGTLSETTLCETLLAGKPALVGKIINLCGQTQFYDLFTILKGAMGHVGGDSVPIQVSNLTQTKVLLLSYPGTNFFETGPLSHASIVLRLDPSTDEAVIAEGTKSFYEENQMTISPAVWYAAKGDIKWMSLAPDSIAHHLKHQLAQYLFFGEEPVMISNEIFQQGLAHLIDGHQLILEYMVKARTRIELRETLQQLSIKVDEITSAIQNYSPLLKIICSWLDTKKSQVSPGTYESILEQSMTMYKDLVVQLVPLQISVLENSRTDEKQFIEGASR